MVCYQGWAYEICRYWISSWGGNMGEGQAKVERVGWTAMLVKVERVTHSLYWLGALGRLGSIRGDMVWVL